MEADLMGAACEGPRLKIGVPVLNAQKLELGFGNVPSGMNRSADVFTARFDDGGPGDKRLLPDRSIRGKHVTFAYEPLRKLLRERTVCDSGFGEHHHSRSLFIE